MDGSSACQTSRRDRQVVLLSGAYTEFKLLICEQKLGRQVIHFVTPKISYLICFEFLKIQIHHYIKADFGERERGKTEKK